MWILFYQILFSIPTNELIIFIFFLKNNYYSNYWLQVPVYMCTCMNELLLSCDTLKSYPGSITGYMIRKKTNKQTASSFFKEKKSNWQEFYKETWGGLQAY